LAHHIPAADRRGIAGAPARYFEIAVKIAGHHALKLTQNTACGRGKRESLVQRGIKRIGTNQQPRPEIRPEIRRGIKPSQTIKNGVHNKKTMLQYD